MSFFRLEECTSTNLPKLVDVHSSLLLPTPPVNFLWIDAIFLDVAVMIDEDVFILVDKGTGFDSNTRVASRTQANGLRGEMVAAGTITHVHVKWRGGRAFFLIAMNIEAMRMRVRPSKEQLLDRRWIAMEVDNYGTFHGEERLKHFRIQTMRMRSFLLKYQQIRDVNYA